MDRRRKVELFEQIRREYRHGVGTIQGTAKKLGVHRRMVRQAWASAIPPARKIPVRGKPKLGPAIEFIDEILRSDQGAPRKQRHTAHRIWERIRQEKPEVVVAEATVRRYVQHRKQELGLGVREIFVPQVYAWGGEAQVDWYEAVVEIDGERRPVQHFAMRSMASGGAFHVAYYHATQQAFLEAHERAFRHFGGVFRLLRYDNLKSAVKKVLRGHQREETERLIAFRSHWGFQTEFCNPARGNEKGGVEGEVGYFRRNHLVPIPRVKDLAELNEHLLRGVRQDEGRRIAGKPLSVGEAMRIEHEHLLPLAAEGFELAETSFPTVDGKGCVKVRTNWYSTPLQPGTRCQARLLPAYVEVWQERECVARHERSFSRYQQVLDLEHYLDVLERKPGALAGSTPLKQWRERGRWPLSFDRLWQSLIDRHGRAAGTRAMIELLQAGKQHGWDPLRHAIEQALELGSTDPAAVLHLLRFAELARPVREGCPVGDGLERYERPLPLLNEYDLLLSPAEAEVARCGQLIRFTSSTTSLHTEQPALKISTFLDAMVHHLQRTIAGTAGEPAGSDLQPVPRCRFQCFFAVFPLSLT
ncbi:MAG: IS21 family transposase [Acidobacteriota bacterium]|nr:IS21 family transposase [Acidobacteriota bacterium]